MKHLVFLLTLFSVSAEILAQNNIGIGTSQPHSSALVHIDATATQYKGLLVTGKFEGAATVPNLGWGSRLMFYPGKAAFRAGFIVGDQWDDAKTGSYSAAFGNSTTASGQYSFATGNETIAIGLVSTALGSQTTASGIASTAMGNSTTASGNASTALGFLTTASGIYSTAMGYQTSASELGSTAMGYQTSASGNMSIAMGISTTAKAFAGVSIGSFNDQLDNPVAYSPLDFDRIFQIGNGSSIFDRRNAITVLRNGKTGIGVLEPAYLLDLAGRMRIRGGGTGSTSAGIWLNKNDNSGLLGFLGVDGNNDIGIYSNTSGWSFVVDDATGNVTVKGTVKANGVTLTSDERLKKDITPLDEAMPLLEKLNGYQYHWKDASWDASLQTGLLAQEVEKVMPELVKTDDKGLKSVNYIGLIPYMLEAFKGQQKEIEELKKLVAELMKK